MAERLMDLIEELDRECIHFLATCSRKSRLRVATKGIRPVLRVASEILALRSAEPVRTAALKTVHPFDIDVLEIAHFPAGFGKGADVTRKVNRPRALINIGVSRGGRLVSQLTTAVAPFRVAGGSAFVTLGDLGTIGVSAYDLVEQTQRLAHAVFMEKTITQKGSAA